MSDVIYKYGPFDYVGNTVDFEGIPLHVGYQDNINSPHSDNRVYLWCRLPASPSVYEPYKGKAKIVATGEKFTGRYIGTVVMPSTLVWHVVEV